MTYENHINKFIDAAAIQAAIDNGDLVKPYVALDASAGTIDYNTRSVTPPAPTTMGKWSDDGQGVYTFQITEKDGQYWGADNPVKIGTLDGVYFQAENPMDLDVNIYYDMSWQVELKGEGLSENPSHSFAPGVSDTWHEEGVLTEQDSSSAYLQVDWDGVDTFVFQRYADGSGPAISMTTIDPPYPAGE